MSYEDDIEFENEELRGAIAQLRSEVSYLTEDLEASHKELTEAQKELEEAQKELEEAQDKVSELENEKEEFEKLIENKVSDLPHCVDTEYLIENYLHNENDLEEAKGESYDEGVQETIKQIDNLIDIEDPELCLTSILQTLKQKMKNYEEES